MTGFKDYLLEDIQADIQSKCQPFLKASEGIPLYRGYGGKIRSLFKGAQELAVRKDRKPRDSTGFTHGLLDAYFEKRFGVKVRSEGLFATGDLKQAKRYGTPHYVFPVGNFKFVWAEREGYPIIDTVHISREIADIMRAKYEREAEGVTEKVMAQYDWHSNDLPRAIKSGAEIAFLCDNVIVVPVGKTPYEKLITG